MARHYSEVRVTWNYHKIILRDNLCPGMNYFYPNGSNCFQNDNFLSIRHEGSLNGLMGMKITWIMSHRSHRWKVIYATFCIKSQSSLKLSYIVALRRLFRHFNGFALLFQPICLLDAGIFLGIRSSHLRSTWAFCSTGICNHCCEIKLHMSNTFPDICFWEMVCWLIWYSGIF